MPFDKRLKVAMRNLSHFFISLQIDLEINKIDIDTIFL